MSRFYNTFQITKNNPQKPTTAMQLQQSGYRLSRFILTPIPKAVLILAALSVLAIMIANTFLVLSFKPKLELSHCLEKYYDLTHQNITDFVAEVTQDREDRISSPDDLNQITKYLNQSRLLQFQEVKNLPDNSQCVIQLNYRSLATKTQPQPQQQQQQSDLSPLQQKTIGYMTSNYPLFSINKTDQAILDKHGIILDRILLPKIDTGYRFVGVDLFVSEVEDFLYAAVKGFVVFEQKFKSRLLGVYERLAMRVLEEQIKEKQAQDKKNATSGTEKSANNTRSINFETNIKLQQKLQPKQPINGNNRLLQQPHQLTNSTQPANQTFLVQTLTKQYKILSNIIATLMFKTTYSKHKIIYTLDSPLSNNGTQEWHSVILPSSPTSEYYSIVWRFVGKIFNAIIWFMYVCFGFYVIGMCVRYAVVFVGSVLGMCGNWSKKMGWVGRFMGMYRGKRDERSRQNLKIMVQIGVAFVCMYGLMAFIGYLLSETVGMIISATEMVPNHTYYSNRVLATFFVIEIYHYIFFRTRTTLQFFYKFSYVFTMTIMMITSYHPYFLTSFFINLHLLFHIFLIICFLILEKVISEEELESGYKPSLDKPRMLFYFGYDLDWHRGVPPIWTMFQPWFDLSYANEQQRSYIDQNYELLYGRLMGVNQPQQLPDEEDENQESASFKNREMLQSSDRN